MAETFKEKEVPKERVLPSVSRARGEEFHSPIDTIGRSASHIRLTSESARLGGARAVIRADQDMAIAKNVSDLKLEGSTSLSERLQNMLASLRK
ncbi:hypothetical protein H0O00_03090 [Candidatus Micrarchaeota archaeon]|nr:hypothetical protein [Candidatus Micrarchaeota archaeon]